MRDKAPMGSGTPEIRNQAEANLSALIESTDDLIWSVDLDSRLITFNSALQKHILTTTGIPLAAGMLPLETMRAESADLISPLYDRALRDGPFRTEFFLEDGRILELSFNPIVTNGETTGISVFGKDISERKRAETALFETEEKYRAIVDGALEGMFQTTPEGKAFFANRALARMLGYDSPEEVVSKIADAKDHIWANPDDRATFVGRIREHDSVLGYECQFKRKNGTRIDVALSARKIFGAGGEWLALEGFIEDISDHKRVEKELRESRDSLREAQIIGGLGTYVLDIPTGRWTSSSLLDELFGIDEGYERSVEGWAALTHPDDWAMMTAYFAEEVIGQKKAFDKEYRITRQTDRSTRWVHGQGRLEFDSNGQPVTMRGVIRDITESKLASQKLEESEARFRRFFEENGSVMLIVDPSNGTIIHANRAAAEYYGLPQEQLIGMSALQMSTSPTDEVERNLQPALAGKRSVFNFRIRTASGVERDVEAYASPVDMDGKQLLYLIVHDISERRRAEAKLRDSEERYRATFQMNIDAININRLSDGVFVDCNEAFLRFTGCERVDVIGRTSQELNFWVDPEDRQKWVEALRRDSRCRDLEARFRRKNGEIVWGQASGSLIEADGVPCILSVTRNITAAKAADERLTAVVEALRLSEDRYRTTFQMSLDVISITRIDSGEYIDVNPAFLELGGYKREEVIGHTTEELGVWADPRDRDRLAEAVRRNGSCRDMEARFRKESGEPFWGLLSASLITIGGKHCLLSVIRDITAAKAADEKLAQAVEALRVSEDRYRTTFQMSLDVISINRMDSGEYVDVNQAFTDLGGYRREEVIGRTSRELGIWADPRDRDRLSEIVHQSGSCRDMEAQFRKKNGELFWGVMSASVIEIDGEPCLLSVTRDVTAAKAADGRLAAAMDALRASEAHYRTVFQTSVDGIVVSQLHDGRFIDANKAFLDLMEFEREEIVGRTSLDLDFWTEPEVRRNMAAALAQSQSFRDVETQFIKKNGERIWILLSSTAMEIEGTPCVLSVVRNISAAKAAEEGLAAAQRALQASEERYRTAFQTSLDSININRLSDGYYVDCNRAFLDLVGYTREEVIGHTSVELNIWANARDRQSLVDMVRQTGSCRDLEAQFRKKNGDVFWGQMSASVIEIDGVPCILSISRDISDAKVAEDEIRTLAFYDPLTHLPNRRLVSERLRQSLAASARSSRKGALLFFDVDNFKTLNDTLGHKTGDLLLQEIGRRLTGCIREVDTVARLGGDEFVVILEDLSESPEEAAAHAKVVAQKILGEVCQTYLLAGRECLSTSSIGITLFGNRTDTIDDVLQQADIAMYQAKAAGRNTLRFFAPELQAAINTRASMEEEMRQAIGGGQFQLYYQPQVQFGALIGAEVLLRWNHPARGFLPPADFIPLAEETGQILRLGEWVLETACRQIAAWSQWKETAHITVAVNISARQLRQPDFVEQVLGALERAGANPKNLELELTESMLVDNIEEVIAKMTVLKSHGLRISLDDFGTGYSSLSYLKRLPLDQLKIDRAFVHDMLVDVTSGAIAQTVISLSKAMGLSVMAEGVETEEQRDFLASLGCHAFQGFLFSPPLPLRDFEMLLPEIAERVVPPPSIH